MDGDITIVALMIPFGLTLLGLGAYMYDQLQKAKERISCRKPLFLQAATGITPASRTNGSPDLAGR